TAMSRRQWPRATSPGAMNPSTRSTPRLIRASWSVASLMASIALSGMPLEARTPDTLRSSTAMAVTIVMIAAISTPIAKPPSVRVRTLPTSPMKPVRYSYQCGRALASSPSFSSPPSRIRPSYRAVDAAGGDGSSPERTAPHPRPRAKVKSDAHLHQSPRQMPDDHHSGSDHRDDGPHRRTRADPLALRRPDLRHQRDRRILVLTRRGSARHSGRPAAEGAHHRHHGHRTGTPGDRLGVQSLRLRPRRARVPRLRLVRVRQGHGEHGDRVDSRRLRHHHLAGLLPRPRRLRPPGRALCPRRHRHRPHRTDRPRPRDRPAGRVRDQNHRRRNRTVNANTDSAALPPEATGASETLFPSGSRRDRPGALALTIGFGLVAVCLTGLFTSPSAAVGGAWCIAMMLVLLFLSVPVAIALSVP